MNDVLTYYDELQQVGFAQVAEPVVFDNRLSDGAFRTYICLLTYMWRSSKRAPFPSTKLLAARRGVCRDTISRQVQELKKSGFIQVQSQGIGKSNIYYLMPMSMIYGKKDNPHALNEQARELCTEPTLDEDEPTETEEAPSVADALAQGVKKSMEGKAKYQERRAAKIKDGTVKTKPVDIKTAKRKGKWSIRRGIWDDAHKDAYQGALPVAWTAKDKKHINELVDSWDEGLVLMALEYIVSNWEELAERFGMGGAPNIHDIYTYRNELFMEIQTGKRVVSKREKYDAGRIRRRADYDQGGEEFPEVGWGEAT